MPFQLSHQRGRVIADEARQPRRHARQLRLSELGEGAHLDAPKSQGLEQAGHQAGETSFRHHHRQPLLPKALGVPLMQSRQPMERDGGLAAAGASQHQQRTIAAAIDELELHRIEEGGDIEPYPAHPANTDTQPALGGPAATCQGGQILLATPRPARGRSLEPSRRRGDGAQLTVDDHHRATRLDAALDSPAWQVNLVGIALAVTIVELRERRVSPVEDAETGDAIEERRMAQQVVSLARPLPEPKVSEVRAPGLGQRDLVSAAVLDRPDRMQLIEDGRQVLLARRGRVLAQLLDAQGRISAQLARRAQLE